MLVDDNAHTVFKPPFIVTDGMEFHSAQTSSCLINFIKNVSVSVAHVIADTTIRVWAWPSSPAKKAIED
jgi:hypothetical protein